MGVWYSDAEGQVYGYHIDDDAVWHYDGPLAVPKLNSPGKPFAVSVKGKYSARLSSFETLF